MKCRSSWIDGQRDVDDRDVEHHHELHDAEQRQRIPTSFFRLRPSSRPVPPSIRSHDHSAACTMRVSFLTCEMRATVKSGSCQDAEELQAVLPHRTRSRHRRRALVAPRHPRAHARSQRTPTSSSTWTEWHEHPRRPAAKPRGGRDRPAPHAPTAGCIEGVRAHRYRPAAAARSAGPVQLGLRRLGPPAPDAVLAPGWLEQALRSLAACADPGLKLTVHRGGETASITGGDAQPGAIEGAQAVIEGDPPGFLPYLFLSATRILPASR